MSRYALTDELARFRVVPAAGPKELVSWQGRRRAVEGNAVTHERIRRAVLAGLLFAPIAGSTQPQRIQRLDGSSIASEDVDSAITRVMTSADVTGVAIAVIDDGHIVYAKAYGYRDTATNSPLTPDSVMSAASFTKSAFAYMVMQLVAEHRLDLDKAVVEYLPKPLPQYPGYADLAGDGRYRRITARMLLAHTSGLPNLRFLEPDRKLKIRFDPGTRFAYSGEGMMLLQLVVETITNESLTRLMDERVFRPLEMTRTSMVWQERFDSDAANGYDAYGRSLGPQKRTAPNAAGSMLTTVRDYARLLQAMLTGQRLSAPALQQMLAPQIRIHSKHEFPTDAPETTTENDAIRLSYGLGWGLYWSPVGEAFFKEGHDDGWRNYAVGFVERKSGMVIMTNSGNGEGIFKDVLETVLADTYTPIEWEGYTPYDKLPPRPPLTKHTVVHVDTATLEKYAGKYVLPGNVKVVLTIERSDDHLTIQENDEPRQTLLPESQTQFFSTASDDVVRFDMDGRGRVTHMILHVDGKDIRIPRQ
jgi:CubicO group peptidase (beta-lactamase class C family)